MSSPGAYRFRQKSPQSKFLLAIFFITLVLVVVNQVFLNVMARQQQVYAKQISDLRVLSLQLARQAEVAANGDEAAFAVLASTRTDFQAGLALLIEGKENTIDTGFGLTLPLPGQQAAVRDAVIPQTWERMATNIDQILALELTSEEQAVDASATVVALMDDSALLQTALSELGDFVATGGRSPIESPLIGYALLLVLLLTIGGYGQQVIRRSREAEQFTAEKNQRNNEAVSKLIGEISSLADGDLTVEATIDEEFTGSIADSINYAVGQLRGLVSAITDVTLQVTTSTDSSTQRVQALSEASRRQSESIDSVYVSIREIGKDINLVSDNAQKSLKVAGDSVITAAGGADVVKDTIKGMDGIRDQIQDTSRRIKRLGESSQAIGSFVSLINDIAAHTNTLSLNAAIQAASAGDAGKGFAVVADEVHALAERSGDATRQIENLVKVIQGDIKEVVQSMEQTTAEVVTGTGLARKAGAALDDIQRVSKQLAELVSSITDASRNQTKAASELKSSMEVIRQVTLKTSGGIEETREFILKLGGLTERLQLAVAGFSLSKKDKWARMKKDNVTALEPKKPVFVNNHHDDISGRIITA